MQSMKYNPYSCCPNSLRERGGDMNIKTNVFLGENVINPALLRIKNANIDRLVNEAIDRSKDRYTENVG